MKLNLNKSRQGEPLGAVESTEDSPPPVHSEWGAWAALIAAIKEIVMAAMVSDATTQRLIRIMRGSVIPALIIIAAVIAVPVLVRLGVYFP